MKPSSTAIDCGKILFMAHTFAFESAGLVPGHPTPLDRHALTSAESEILSTIAEVLKPETANACSCVESLDRRLQGPLARLLPAYQQGLAAVDCSCVQQTGKSLLDLETSERRLFVRKLRTGHKLTAFFCLVTGTCLLPA